MVSKRARNDFAFRLASSQDHRFRPHRVYQLLAQVEPQHFDVVVVACSQLQQIQAVVAEAAPLMAPDALVVIESTRFVNLEPFVLLSLPKGASQAVVSIMNELDVRPVSTGTYAFVNRCPHEPRVYLGTSLSDARTVQANRNYQRFAKLWAAVQSSRAPGSVAVVKALNKKEFMTYQWKLALPAIVFHLLLVVFEADTPQALTQQILCKPLVTGLVNEVFRIIKKMDCKLVKGSENEANLVQNELTMFRGTPTPGFPPYFHANPLFYSFYHKHALDTDLLLLQPILLGDDHGVRTPYLENLYSIICQLARINKDSTSVFFQRKDSKKDSSEDGSKSKELAAEYSRLQEDVSLHDAKLLSLVLQITEAEQQLLAASERAQTALRATIEAEERAQNAQKAAAEAEQRVQNAQRAAVEAEQRVQSAQRATVEAEQRAAAEEQRINALRAAEEQRMNALRATADEQGNRAVGQKAVEEPANVPADVMTPQANLHEFANIVVYDLPARPKEEQGEREQGVKEQGREQEQMTPKQVPSQMNGAPNGYAYGSGGSGGSNGSNSNNVPNGYNGNNAANGFNGNMANGYNGGANNGPGYAPGYGPGYNGQAYNGPGYNGPGYNGPGYNGPAYNGSGYNGSGYNGPAYNGPGYNAGSGPSHPGPGPGYAGSGPSYSSSHSGQPATLAGPYKTLPKNGSYSNMDQIPPHGLPSTGMPGGQLPPHLRGQELRDSMVSNVNRYQQPGPRRVPSGASYYDMSGMQSNLPSFNNAAPIDPFLELRFKANPKKPNRRSALPSMSGNIDGMDMGGRGGMPQPGQSAKYRSMAPGTFGPGLGSLLGPTGGSSGSSAPTGASSGSSGPTTSSISPQNRAASASLNFLQPPVQNALLGSSTQTYDTPKTNEEEGVNSFSMAVPETQAPETPAVPLGGIASSEPSKKKKGFFRRKK